MICVDSNQSRAMAAIKDKLRRVIATDRRGEADPVEARTTARAGVVAQANQMQTRAAGPGGTIMKKAARQSLSLGGDAAQDRPQHRAEHRADPPHHQGRGLQVRERRQQDGLAERHDRRAERTLRREREDRASRLPRHDAAQQGGG